MKTIKHTGIWAFVAAIGLVAVCFANSLPNDFVLDDYQIVAVNPAIRTIAPLRQLTSGYWGTANDAGIYRPLTVFSYSLEYPLWKRWPGGYRLTNLLLHAINGFLVFLLARRLLGSDGAAWAAAAIYVAHPAHTEAVVALIGRGELLAAMFFLLAWILFRRRQAFLSALAFLLALLSKENAIVLPAVVLLDWWLLAAKRRQSVAPGVSPGSRSVSDISAVGAEDSRESVAPTGLIADVTPTPGLRPGLHSFATSWLALVAVASAYLALRVAVIGGIGIPKAAQYLGGSWTFVQRELTSGRAFLKYFQLLLAPIDLAGDYDFNSIPLAGLTDPVAWAGVLLILATITFALAMRKQKPVLAFSILFFYVAILPVSNWIFPTTVIMAERHLYLPSLGVCLIAGMAWAGLPTVALKRVAGAGIMGLAVLLCIAHNYIWRDNLSFYGNVVRVFPNNARGRQGYGIALAEAGRVKDALTQFDAGLQVRRDAPLLVGKAQSLMQLERGCANARPVLAEALALQPFDSFAQWLAAKCFEREGDIARAEQIYRTAVLNTSFPDPRLLLDWGVALERLHRPAEALDAYRRATSLSPDDPVIRSFFERLETAQHER